MKRPDQKRIQEIRDNPDSTHTEKQLLAEVDALNKELTQVRCTYEVHEQHFITKREHEMLKKLASLESEKDEALQRLETLKSLVTLDSALEDFKSTELN